MYGFENQPGAKISTHPYNIGGQDLIKTVRKLIPDAISEVKFEFSIFMTELTSELILLESQFTLSGNSELRRLKSANPARNAAEPVRRNPGLGSHHASGLGAGPT